MVMTFQRAARTAVKLKIGIQGPAGSGKTLGALYLAHGLVPNGRVALIDTENGSAALYADRFQFDTLRLDEPYESARYLEALGVAVDAGYDVIIIDSLSHQWAGPGGILSRKEQKDARGGNSFTNWGAFSKEHSGFQASLLGTPAHVIATLRTKQEYVVEADSKGKSAPKKMGLAAIQREGFDYEFSLMFELQMDHMASASKDRTGLFDTRLVDLRQTAVARELRTWLESAAPAAKPTATPRVSGADQGYAYDMEHEEQAAQERTALDQARRDANPRPHSGPATTEQMAEIGLLVRRPECKAVRAKIEARLKEAPDAAVAVNAIEFLRQTVKAGGGNPDELTLDDKRSSTNAVQAGR